MFRIKRFLSRSRSRSRTPGKRSKQRPNSEYLNKELERPVEAIPEESSDARVGAVAATLASVDGASESTSLVIGHTSTTSLLVPPVKSALIESPQCVASEHDTQPNSQEQCPRDACLAVSTRNAPIHTDNTSSTSDGVANDSATEDDCNESAQITDSDIGVSESEDSNSTAHTTEFRPTECSHHDDEAPERTEVSSTVQTFLKTQYKGEIPPGSTLLEDLKSVNSVIEVVQNTGPLVVSVGGKGPSQYVTKSGPYESGKGSSADVLVKEINEMNNRGDIDSKALQDKVKQKQQIVESREQLRENPPPTTTAVGSLNQPVNNHTDTDRDSTAGADPSSGVGDNSSSDAGTDPPSNSEMDTEANPPLNAGSNPSSTSETSSSNTGQNTSSDIDAGASSSADSSDNKESELQPVTTRPPTTVKSAGPVQKTKERSRQASKRRPPKQSGDQSRSRKGNRSRTRRSLKRMEFPEDSDSSYQRITTSEVVSSDTLMAHQFPNGNRQQVGQSPGRSRKRRKKRKGRKPSGSSSSHASTEGSGGGDTSSYKELSDSSGSEVRRKPQDASQPHGQQSEQVPGTHTAPQTGPRGRALGGRQLFESAPVQETGSSGPSEMAFPRPPLQYTSEEHSTFHPQLEQPPAHSLVFKLFTQQTDPATGEVVPLAEDRETGCTTSQCRPVYLSQGALCLSRGTGGVQGNPLRWFVVNVIRGQCDAGSVFHDAMAVWIAAGRPKEMRHMLVALLQFLQCENRSLLDINSIRVSEGVLAAPVSAVSVSSTVWSQLNSVRILARLVEEFLELWDTSQQQDSCLSDIVPLRQFLAWVHRLESGAEMVGACPLEDALLQLGEMSLRQRPLFVVTDIGE